jgi:hypothetical protein
MSNVLCTPPGNVSVPHAIYTCSATILLTVLKLSILAAGLHKATSRILFITVEPIVNLSVLVKVYLGMFRMTGEQKHAFVKLEALKSLLKVV